MKLFINENKKLLATLADGNHLRVYAFESDEAKEISDSEFVSHESPLLQARVEISGHYPCLEFYETKREKIPGWINQLQKIDVVV